MPNCWEFIEDLDDRDYVLTHGLIVGMWNEFLMAIGAPSQEFIMDVPSLFDPSVHADFIQRIENMEYAEPGDPTDINFTIQIDPDTNAPHLVDDPMWTPPVEVDEPEVWTHDYNYVLPNCPETVECVYCEDPVCVPWFWCENRKEYKVFCNKPEHWQCDDLPECVTCPESGKNCDRVFECDEGYVEVQECEVEEEPEEEDWPYKECGAPQCYECP